MHGFRPQADARYLERQRLLERLPDQSGYVVLLEAPYGYGKSVLASQWARSLEDGGWRAVWLSGRYSGLLPTLATALGLPSRAPWPVVLDALWAERTLLVLEDLEGLDDQEELTVVLRDVRGLALLATRSSLATSELPRLHTQARLVRLGAEDLAFSADETAELFPDDSVAAQMLAVTRGWPLPVHFASITGELPDRAPLVEGMRGSLSESEWEEALLLATVHHMPSESASGRTRALADTGFVQLGDAGYRLHPLVAEHMLSEHGAHARAVLEREQDRLPKLLLGEALERCGDLLGLAVLFEAPRAQVYRHAPETFVRWDALIGGEPTPRRHITVGGALKVLGRFDEAVSRLRAALATDDLSAEDEVLALKDMCWAQATFDLESAEATVLRGEARLAEVDDELAGRFLSDASFVDVMAGRLDLAAAKLKRALERLPRDNPYRTGISINLALNLWDRLGDFDGRLAAQAETLPEVWRLYPSDAPGQCRDLATLHWWTGDVARAREYLERARAGARSSPLVRLEATAALAAMDGETAAFPGLVATAARWEDDYTLDAVARHAILTLPEEATLALATEYFEAVRAPVLSAAAYALRLAAAGEERAALAVLADAEGRAGARAYRLYLSAARYRVSRQATDLEGFLSVTTAGTRLLPGFVPLSELPRDRPELAAAYPLREVLASGWKEAVESRAHEIPSLEVTLLGGFELRLMGDAIELTDRQKQMVTLFVMGRDRNQVAEALWPEVDEDRQRNNMGVQASLLRSALEPWGVATFVHKDGLRRVASDLDALRDALEAGDAGTVSRVYREPFAGGLEVGAIAEHGDWLRQKVIDCLTSGARAADNVTAADYLSRALELDPLNEDTLRDLLIRLRASGRTHLARRRMAEFEARLMQETGLEPLPETLSVLQEN